MENESEALMLIIAGGSMEETEGSSNFRWGISPSIIQYSWMALTTKEITMC